MTHTNTRQERRAIFESASDARQAIISFARTAKTVASSLAMSDNGAFLFQLTGDSWTLEYPTPGSHYKAVYFSKIAGHPEMVRITSSNYSCEDEVNGLYSRTDARAFYVKLIKAGFVRKSAS